MAKSKYLNVGTPELFGDMLVTTCEKLRLPVPERREATATTVYVSLNLRMDAFLLPNGCAVLCHGEDHVAVADMLGYLYSFEDDDLVLDAVVARKWRGVRIAAVGDSSALQTG